MNIQDYISSGVIENHVLGLTSPEEAAELEKLRAVHPEIQQALLDAEAVLENYALAHRKEPPKAVKGKIARALFEENTDSGHRVTSAQTSSQQAKKTPSQSFYFAVAASVLFLLSIGFHLYKSADYQRQIEALKQENQQLIAQNETFLAQIQRASEEIRVVTDPAIITVTLGGVPGHENSRAFVYWNTTTHEVYLKPDRLPALPRDKQYQLWGIVDGKPVSAGVYTTDDAKQLLQQMESFEKAEMFAITIENAGGSTQPTLDQMVVAGKI